MTDAGYNFGQTDPNWWDVLRTGKLPAYKNQYGAGGNVFSVCAKHVLELRVTAILNWVN
jgi:hypothetical protein